LSADVGACARLRDRGLALPCAVGDATACDSLPARVFDCAGGSFTPARRAFDRPMAAVFG
jgi:hypothetical protein